MADTLSPSTPSTGPQKPAFNPIEDKSKRLLEDARDAIRSLRSIGNDEKQVKFFAAIRGKEIHKAEEKFVELEHELGRITDLALRKRLMRELETTRKSFNEATVVKKSVSIFDGLPFFGKKKEQQKKPIDTKPPASEQRGDIASGGEPVVGVAMGAGLTAASTVNVPVTGTDALSTDPSVMSPQQRAEAQQVVEEQLALAIEKSNAYGKPKTWTVNEYGNKVSLDKDEIALTSKVQQLAQRKEMLASSVSGSVSTTTSTSSTTPAPQSPLAQTRRQLDGVRSQMMALNAKLEAYDTANPGKLNSPESKELEAQYAPLRARFDQLQALERQQEADPANVTAESAPAEIDQALEKVRTQLQGLNRRNDSSRMASASPNSQEKKMVEDQIDSSTVEFQRLSALQGQKEEGGEATPAPSTPQRQAPLKPGSQLPASNPQPSATMSGGGDPPPLSLPTPGGTSTGYAGDSMNASVDVKTGKIDFVDTILYSGFAVMLDGLGLIPGVAYATSPLSIGAFKLFFYLNDINPKGANFAMGATGPAEVIPVVSEILPGCTAYVLTTCLLQMTEDRFNTTTATAGGTSAQGSFDLSQKPGTAARKAELNAQMGGHYSGSETSEELGNAPSGMSTSSSGSGRSDTGGAARKAELNAQMGGHYSGSETSEELGNLPVGGTSTGASDPSNFSGQVDFSSFGQASGSREEGRTPSGLPQMGPAATGAAQAAGADTGAGGRFPGGKGGGDEGPTVPDAGPIAGAGPQAGAVRSKQTPRRVPVKPIREAPIHSLDDARKEKARREQKERLERESRAA